MSRERIFKELISEMAKDGDISPSEYSILLEKAKDLGISKNSLDLLIKLELESPANESFSVRPQAQTPSYSSPLNQTFRFKSAITRGGGILTPDIIEIDSQTLTYKKRNKYLINVDSTTIPISKISSIELDTSLWGTDIIIKTYGAGVIKASKFTKSDALQIKKIIQQKQLG